ncbi:MAG: hypothetical protein WA184_06330 [Stellaceae bacterium]
MIAVAEAKPDPADVSKKDNPLYAGLIAPAAADPDTTRQDRPADATIERGSRPGNVEHHAHAGRDLTFAGCHAFGRVFGSEQACDRFAGRPCEPVRGRTDCNTRPFLENEKLVGPEGGFFRVMNDEDRCRRDIALQIQQFAIAAARATVCQGPKTGSSSNNRRAGRTNARANGRAAAGGATIRAR